MRQLEMRLAHARIKMAGVIKAVRKAKAGLCIDKLPISVPFSLPNPPQPHSASFRYFCPKPVLLSTIVVSGPTTRSASKRLSATRVEIIDSDPVDFSLL